VEKRTFFSSGPAARKKTRAGFLDKASAGDLFPNSQFAKEGVSGGQERLADTESGHGLFFDDDGAEARSAGSDSSGGSGRACTDDDDIKLGFDWHRGLIREIFVTGRRGGQA